MTAFIRKNLDPEIRRSNFVVILEWLRNLSEKQETSFHETCILTLCRLARYVTFCVLDIRVNLMHLSGSRMMKK